MRPAEQEVFGFGLFRDVTVPNIHSVERLNPSSPSTVSKRLRLFSDFRH